MATDRDKPGKDGPSGDRPSGRSTSAGRPGASAGSQRRPVTIDLQARDLSKSEPVAKPDPAAPQPSSEATGQTDARKSETRAAKPGADTKAASGAAKAASLASGTATSGMSTARAVKADTTEAGKSETAKSESALPDAGKASSTMASTASAAARGPTGSTAIGDQPTSGAGVTGTNAAGTTADSTSTASEKTSADKTFGTGSAAAAAAGKAPPRMQDQDVPRSAGSPLGLVAAAFVGAALVLAGAYGLHRAGYLPLVDTAAQAEIHAALSAAQSRIASLEGHVADLRASAGTPGATRQEIDSLAERVAALEQSGRIDGSAGSPALQRELAEVRDGLTELRSVVSSGGAGEDAGLAELSKRVAALQQEVDALKGEAAAGEVADSVAALKADVARMTESVDTLTSRLASAEAALTDAGAARSDIQANLAELSSTISSARASTTEALNALKGSIAAIETRLGPLEESIGTPGARETAARALAVSALTAALDAGRSYATELSAVAAALPKETDLTNLSAHADTGLPTKADLIARFPAVARAMASRIEVPVEEGEGSLVDRFLSGAKTFIGIRHVGDGGGNTPVDLLGRMEARVTAGDLAGALAAYEGLPEPVKAAGAEWAGQARARVEADAVVASVTDEVLRGLSGPGG